ncbi:MAG TPA: hypothetical protein PKY58_03290 [Syntrophales bacterium]|nr:hypothetical protein [Syntrophales bacterium]HQN77570.1 hypothetical protein [Syntrophales bacterium]HQQ26526.1 hypothetical protein [Syntrophales bacterium]
MDPVSLMIILGIVLGMIVFLYGRYLSANYGEILPSEEVTRAFESHEVHPGFVYYTSGSEAFPNAIIGIDEKWTLVTDVWKRKDFSPETMKETVENMRHRASTILLPLHGFVILDNKKFPIGIWYSLMEARTRVKMASEREAVVFPPPSDTWNRYEKR